MTGGWLIFITIVLSGTTLWVLYDLLIAARTGNAKWNFAFFSGMVWRDKNPAKFWAVVAYQIGLIVIISLGIYAIWMVFSP